MSHVMSVVGLLSALFILLRAIDSDNAKSRRLGLLLLRLLHELLVHLSSVPIATLTAVSALFASTGLNLGAAFVLDSQSHAFVGHDLPVLLGELLGLQGILAGQLLLFLAISELGLLLSLLAHDVGLCLRLELRQFLFPLDLLLLRPHLVEHGVVFSTLERLLVQLRLKVRGGTLVVVRLANLERDIGRLTQVHLLSSLVLQLDCSEIGFGGLRSLLFDRGTHL